MCRSIDLIAFGSSSQCIRTDQQLNSFVMSFTFTIYSLLPSEVAVDEFDRWVGAYPFSQPNQPPAENRAISTHNAFARLSIILQSIINNVYSPRARRNHFEISPRTGEYMCFVVLRELYGQLCAWRNALPTHLQWTPGSPVPPPLPHQLLLHAVSCSRVFIVSDRDEKLTFHQSYAHHSSTTPASCSSSDRSYQSATRLLSQTNIRFQDRTMFAREQPTPCESCARWPLLEDKR